MTGDATFEDGREAPLNLAAQDGDDLEVLSALVQDSVFPVTEMKWQRRQRRLAFLLNRFRWEDEGRSRHGPERVQSLLVLRDVVRVASQGIDRADGDLVLSLLSISFDPDEAGGGEVTFVLAGDGAIRATVEVLDISLRDVTRPYAAPSGQTPDHG